MDWRLVATAFFAIFVAELGDKTQIAALMMAADTKRPWAVFLGASLALVLVTALGVAVGAILSQHLPELWIKRVGGTAFVVVGLLMLSGRL